ncbi:MAG: creatininase family protein [Spirochaetes bacterium]|nr:creatininase family protein [Spirochaetota bacterium]
MYVAYTTFALERNPPSLVVLGIGAMEQHSHHLPISTDFDIASALAQAVSEQLGAFSLPPLPFSESLVHRGFSGTVYLRSSTLRSVIEDIAESLREWKVQYLSIINCHGGNYTLTPTIREWNLEGKLPHLLHIEPYMGLSEEMGQNLHACEIETSLMLYLKPESVRMEQAVDYVPSFPRSDLSHFSMKDLSPEGVWGYPTKSTAEKGKRFFGLLVEYCVERIRSLQKTFEKG